MIAYELHFTLALGDVGLVLMGIVALLWFVDSIVGFYLTLPARSVHREATRTRGHLSRWSLSWLIKTNTLFIGVFTWHRASGLWLWGVLMVFAWSAVALNLGDQVYEPVMNVFFDREHDTEFPTLAAPRTTPQLTMRDALSRARVLIQQESTRQHFDVIREQWIGYDDARGVYTYGLETSLDVDERFPETYLHFDGDDGRMLAFEARIKSRRSAFEAWIIALHFGAIRELGLPYRIFVCVFGFLVTALSVTGIWIWWRKRSKRRGPTI